MYSEIIRNIFQNYFSTVEFSHSSEIEETLQKSSKSLFVDIFAFLPELQCWVLCWSATASNTANRVFIADSHMAFSEIQKSASNKIRHFPVSVFRPNNTHEHDIALLARRTAHDVVAFVPISNQSGNIIGVIRLIGPENNLRLLKFDRDADGYIWNQHKDVKHPCIPDPDLIPHVLGRWAGSFFDCQDSIKVIQLLLSCFSSFFEKSHNMYYRRDFDNDILEFLTTTTPKTGVIVNELKASIYDHKYMFTIVAERGATEVVANFPEDLPSNLRLNYTQWSPNLHFYQLRDALNTEKVSFIGIPLKVDDAVIGVFTLIAPVPTDGNGFIEAARFVRSTLSEMGRTIDKKAMTRSSQIVRSINYDNPHLKDFERSVPHLSKELIGGLTKQIVPYGHLSVGVIEARLGGNADVIKGLPKNISDYLQNSIPNLVLSGEMTFYISTERKPNTPITGVLIIPITSSLPFIVYVFGPIALLTGRTLRTALEQSQATLNLSLEASERSATSDFELSSWRGHLALWAKIHELKNRTAGFAKPLRDLIAVTSNGDFLDLKEEVLSFKDTFTSAIEEFELECNDILRGTSFRSIKAEPLVEIIRRTLSVLAQFPEMRSKVQVIAVGNFSVILKTYTAELELVIKDLVRNILQHFEREAKTGQIIFETEQLKDGRIQVRLSDTIAARPSVHKVNKILDNPDSRDSLRRHVKPTVEKLLQGEIYAIEHEKHNSVCIVINLPLEVTVH